MLMNSIYSKVSVCALLLFIGTLLSVSAQTSAFDSLEAFGKNRGDKALKRVLAITGAFGQDQPPQWMILSKDISVNNLRHEYIVKKGQIVAERNFTAAPDPNLPTATLPLDQLNTDSKKAFITANRAASNSNIGFDSVNYLLRIHHTSPSPIWTLTLLDQQKNTVGIIFVSASSGKMLSKKWFRPGTPEYTEMNNRSAADDIKNIWNKGVNSVSKGFQKLDKKIEEKMNRNKPTINPAYKPNN